MNFFLSFYFHNKFGLIENVNQDYFFHGGVSDQFNFKANS